MLKTRKPLLHAALSTAILLATGFAGSAFAQSSDPAPSVAEAAKRAREQKKNAAKPIRTLTDDDLPKSTAGGVSVTGAPPAVPADDATAKPSVGR